MSEDEDKDIGAVFTRCVVTGRTLDTGIETDLGALRAAFGFIGRVFCPACEAEHEWTATDAWIAGPGEKPE